MWDNVSLSLRALAHVLEDIDRVHRYVTAIRETVAETGHLSPRDVQQIGEAVKYHPALGMRRRTPRQIRFSERFPGAPPDALVRVERHSASESCEAESEH